MTVTDLTRNMSTLKWLLYVVLLVNVNPADCSSTSIYPGAGINYGLIRPQYHYYKDMDMPIAYRRQAKCNGEDNLKEDISVISFKLGAISSVAGLFSLTEFSVPSNNISIISTVISLLLWVPSALLTFLAWSDPISYTTGNLVNLGSLLITLYGGLGIFFGTADIVVSTMDEMLGITSLILSALTTFPNMFDELKLLLQEVFGREEVNDLIDGYGCTQNEFTFIRKMLLESVK
ncbi:unnamed protein product [Orchesella dallaii]|uniref:Uncharacterized protein n=1 Tax=Orchesella dallaii TaxID=48710 RepID=A0ABP1QRG4_9HEXA